MTFFRHHRMVEQRDRKRVFKLAYLKKSIYSLCPDLLSLSRAANDRYIQFLSAIDDPTPGGFRNRSLREHLGGFRSTQVSRLLKRLRLHGIIKKVGKTYKYYLTDKYYLTEFGRHVALVGLTLKNLFLVPEFAAAAALAH